MDQILFAQTDIIYCRFVGREIRSLLELESVKKYENIYNETTAGAGAFLHLNLF